MEKKITNVAKNIKELSIHPDLLIIISGFHKRSLFVRKFVSGNRKLKILNLQYLVQNKGMNKRNIKNSNLLTEYFSQFSNTEYFKCKINHLDAKFSINEIQMKVTELFSTKRIQVTFDMSACTSALIPIIIKFLYDSTQITKFEVIYAVPEYPDFVKKMKNDGVVPAINPGSYNLKSCGYYENFERKAQDNYKSLTIFIIKFETNKVSTTLRDLKSDKNILLYADDKEENATTDQKKASAISRSLHEQLDAEYDNLYFETISLFDYSKIYDRLKAIINRPEHQNYNHTIACFGNKFQVLICTYFLLRNRSVKFWRVSYEERNMTTFQNASTRCMSIVFS